MFGEWLGMVFYLVLYSNNTIFGSDWDFMFFETKK